MYVCDMSNIYVISHICVQELDLPSFIKTCGTAVRLKLCMGPAWQICDVETACVCVRERGRNVRELKEFSITCVPENLLILIIARFIYEVLANIILLLLPRLERASVASFLSIVEETH